MNLKNMLICGFYTLFAATAFALDAFTLDAFNLAGYRTSTTGFETFDDRKQMRQNQNLFSKSIIIIRCVGYEIIGKNHKKYFKGTSTGTLVVPNKPYHKRQFETVLTSAHSLLNPDGTPRTCYTRSGFLGAHGRIVKLSLEYVHPLWKEGYKKFLRPDGQNKKEVSYKFVHRRLAEDLAVAKTSERLTTWCPPNEDCGDLHMVSTSNGLSWMKAIDRTNYRLLESGQHPTETMDYLATAGFKKLATTGVKGGWSIVAGVASRKGTIFSGYNPNCKIKFFWEKEKLAITGCDTKLGHSGGPLALGYLHKTEPTNLVTIGVASAVVSSSGDSLFRLLQPEDIQRIQDIHDRAATPNK